MASSLLVSVQVPDVSSLGSSSQMALQSGPGNPPEDNSVVTLLYTPFQLDYHSAFGSIQSTAVGFQPSLAAVGRGRTVRHYASFFQVVESFVGLSMNVGIFADVVAAVAVAVAVVVVVLYGWMKK